jgi:N-acetylmuramoyl-L-alanine amidase
MSISRRIWVICLSALAVVVAVALVVRSHDGGGTPPAAAAVDTTTPAAATTTSTTPGGAPSGARWSPAASRGAAARPVRPAGSSGRSAATTSAAPAASPLAGRTITVNPGHNGGNFDAPSLINRLVNDGNGDKPCDTTGTAAPDGYRETDFTWDVALRLRRLLTAEGARVVMTRSSNTGVGPCVNERAAIGNRAHSAAVVSIHADGGPPGGSGFAVLVPAAIPSGADGAILAPSHRLGVDIREGLLGIGLHTSTYDGRDGIALRTDLAGLNLSRVPAVFVEVANMQNRVDEAPMETPAYRERVAHALADGLTRYLTP